MARMDQPGLTNRILPMLDGIAKALVILALLLYSVGLLITNMYFQRFGIVSFSLVRVRYITTGLLWTFLLTITFLLNCFYSYLFNGKSKPVRFLWLGGVIFTTVLVSGFLSTKYGEAAGRPVIAALFMFGALQLTISMAKLLARAISRFRLLEGKDHAFRTHAVLDAVIASLFIFFSICLFGATGYPFVSQSMGGGQLFQIELQIKADRRPGVANLGLTISKDGKLGPTNLISEESDSLIITQSGPLDTKVTAYRIPKDALDGAVLFDSNYR